MHRRVTAHDESDAERYARVAALFAEVVDLDIASRSAVLDRACRGDDLTRRSVEALLAEDDRAERDSQHRLERIEVSSSPSPSSAFAQRSDAFADVDVRADHRPEIPGYELRDVLGHGGMGIVYRAWQPSLRREVALKVLPAMMTSASPRLAERFRREAASAAGLCHPNIVPIHAFGESNDHHYYAMELVDGVTVDQLIRFLGGGDLEEGVREVCEALVGSVFGEAAVGEIGARARNHLATYFRQVSSWMATVAHALDFAHGQGVIHRDIKPGNLIIDRRGGIKVTDFGLAKSEFEQSMTLDGELMGTLRYISPEQALGGRVPIDRRVDVYALGATLYELLTLRPVFGDVDKKQLLAAIIGCGPVPARQLVPDVPVDLDAICRKSMERVPSERYASAGAMAADLRAFVDDAPVTAPRRVRRSEGASRRRRAWIVGAVLLLLAGMIAVPAVLSRGASSDGLFDEALLRQKDHEWSAAADLYERILDDDPDNVRAMGNLAIVLKEQFNEQDLPDVELLGRAEMLCESALDHDPEHAGIWNVLGVIRKKRGDLDGALDAYLSALDLEGEARVRMATLDNLAEVYGLRTDLAGLEETLDEAVAVATEGGINPWYVLRDRAMLKAAVGDDTFRDDLAAVFASRKDAAWSAYAIRAWLGYLVGEIGGHVDPARDAMTALELAPPDGRVHRLAALAFMEAGEDEAALVHCDRALALGDSVAINHLVAARAESALGNEVRARARYNAALAARPEALIDAGYALSTERGMLWIDTADYLRRLLDEVRNELGIAD